MGRAVLSWILGIAVVALVLGLPALHYRIEYDQTKRLRVVTDGKFLRSGQLTAEGFREAHRKYGYKSVINLQEEAVDPLIPERAFRKPSIRQKAVLDELKVNYFQIDGGVLDHVDWPADLRPPMLDEFLEILDNPKNYPILIHCKAGLHRTGLMTAIYRMEYEKKSVAEVVEELKANGFGTFAATDGNFYLRKLILDYVPGQRWPQGKLAKPAPNPPAGGQ
jgi:tyrosine-protein phosphatase SIW14